MAALIKALKDENGNTIYPQTISNAIVDDITPKIEVNGIVKGDGTGAVTSAVAGVDYLLPSGAIDKANKLTTARTISLTNEISGSVTFDGSSNVSISTTINKSTIINLIYPVGSIYMSVNSTSPSTLFPGTTWVAWGAGKVPVGIDTSDSDFSTTEKTGGNKAHTHTLSHTHTIPGVAHTHTTAGHTLTVSEMPSHSHAYYGHNISATMTGSGTTIVAMHQDHSYNYGESEIIANGGNGSHSHGNTGSTTPTDTTTSAQSTVTTSSTSNLQPYITCYMWKRTA